MSLTDRASSGGNVGGSHKARLIVGVAGLLGLVVAIPPVSVANTAVANDWDSSVSATPDRVAPGGTVRFAIDVTSDVAAEGLVDIEVFDSRGLRVFQHTWDSVVFQAGQMRSFSTSWTAPARTGRYRVKLGVFGPGGAGLRYWDDSAGSVRVTGGTTETTTTLAPTTTRPTTTTTTAPPPTTTTIPRPPGSVLFFEDFTGDTMANFTSTFDWSVVDLWRGDASWQGHHDMSCGGPTTERTLHHAPISNTDPGPEFWLCGPNGPTSDHLMTSNGDNHTFGITAFSPKPSFSGNQVCWDVNQTVSPGRRLWWEVQVIPAAAVTNARSLASLGLMVNGVDFERGSAYVGWGIGIDGTYMKRPNPPTGIIFDFTEEMVRIWRGQTLMFNPGNGWEPGVRYVTTDRATRAHHCMVDNGNGTMTLTQQRGTETYTRTVPVSFPKPYRVIFSAQNYNAGKDGTASNQTWHWDNILVSS
jgi:hypothetical protein